jgi:hypothetical protein
MSTRTSQTRTILIFGPGTGPQSLLIFFFLLGGDHYYSKQYSASVDGVRFFIFEEGEGNKLRDQLPGTYIEDGGYFD